MPIGVMVPVVVRAVAVVFKTPMLIVAALGDMAADVMMRMLARVMALHARLVEHPEVAALDRLVATLRRAVALAVPDRDVENESLIERIAGEVKDLCDQFPAPGVPVH